MVSSPARFKDDFSTSDTKRYSDRDDDEDDNENLSYSPPKQKTT